MNELRVNDEGFALSAGLARSGRYLCAIQIWMWCLARLGTCRRQIGGFAVVIRQESYVMGVSSEQYMKADKLVVGGLIEVVSLAEQITFPAGPVDSDDIEMVIDALRVLRPDARELDALEGMLWMSRGRWEEAVQTLQALLQQKPDFLYAKGLLALALFSRGDFEWRQVADELDESDVGEDTRQLVRSLRARADLRTALDAYKKTGNFVLPESCAEPLIEFEQENAATEDKPTDANAEFIHQPSFLRL
ncbi:ATP-dependent RNA helicase HrpB [Apophysomyces sp. BC1034]|nr:ATP-dependent RNA helicase HrpB [Apophysomyces sp. BC1015]KAG0192568.1 ATP-dependent RNA helicase HrpB [Apophysomyces sp. BC1034]